MRQRALTISIMAILALALAACNSTGLPDVATPTPKTEPTTAGRAEATATVPDIAEAPSATPRVEAGTPPPSATKGTAPDANADANTKLLLQIEKDTAKLRGLTPQKDVPEQFITEDQLRENLTKDMAAEYSKTEAAQDANELWLLRMIPDPSIDLYQLYIDLQTEQVAGYYDPKKDELFVRSDGGPLSPSSRETLAHEFTHALQDQHYDLDKMLPSDTTDDDGSLAVRALVEGDATISGLLYARSYMSQKDYNTMIEESKNAPTDVLDKAPRYIRDNLYFPYQQGVEFVIQLGILDSFAGANKALQDPPVSTEQILHPEKYINSPRDLPKPVALPPLTDTLGTDWTMTSNGTLGEYDFQIILEENNASKAETAAAGWGGAIYNHYENADKALVMVNTVWDTKTDANEFEAAMKQSFSKDKKDGDFWTDGKRFFALKPTGDTIAFGAATDRTALEKAMAQIK